MGTMHAEAPPPQAGPALAANLALRWSRTPHDVEGTEGRAAADAWHRPAGYKGANAGGRLEDARVET